MPTSTEYAGDRIWTTWVHDILLRGKGTAVQHCLVLKCLDMNIWDLAKQLSEDLAFEPGPWPCLNPACKDFQQDVIARYTPLISEEGKPSGRFECHCGFAYRRQGPDPAGRTRTKPERFLETGSIWQRQLRILWPNPDETITSITRRLGVSRLKVVGEAFRIGLPAGDDRPLPKLPEKRLKESIASLRKRHRATLLDALKREKMTRSDLYRKYGGPIDWLRKHDREWVESNIPKSKKSGNISTVPQIDWNARDRELEDKVPAAREKLLQNNVSFRQACVAETRV